MKVSFFIILCFASLAANSQTWAPIGANWIYSHWDFDDITLDPVYSIGTYDVEGDTLLQGHLCSIITKGGFDFFADGRTNTEYMYLSNDTVYFYDTTFAEFQVLYCFNAVVNDFWYFKFDAGSSDIDSIKVTVNAISSMLINSNALVQLDVTYVKINEGMVTDEHFGTVVETIGDLESMFNYSNPYGVEYWAPGGLRCYNDINLGHFENVGVNGDCYMNVESSKNDELKYYPNPATDKLFLENFADLNSLKIYSADGRLMYSSNEFSNGWISLSNFDMGMYLIFWETKNGTVESSRLIKI